MKGTATGLTQRLHQWVRGWGVLPALVLLVTVFLIPVSQLLRLSLIDDTGQLSSEHYLRLFESGLYFRVLGSTFNISLWTAVVCLIAGYPVAYLLATTTGRARSSLVLWVLMPFWTSVLVRSFAWIVILGRQGLLNQILTTLGLTDAPLELIYNFASVIVGMSHAMMPLAILTMLAVMQNIDRNLHRAAATLGARGSHIFWRIYFPLSLPGVAAAGLLVFITSLGFFVTPTLLGSPRETMLAQVIVVQIDEMLDWGFAGAVAVLLLVASIAVFYVFDLVLGMTALTGDIKATNSRRGGSLNRAGARFGYLITAALGWIGAYAGELYDRLPGRGKVQAPERPRVVLWATVMAVVIFLAAPSFFLVPISFSGSSFFEWPPRGFSLRWYEALFASPLWQQAMIRSVWVGLCTAVLSVIIGTPAAFALSRQKIPAKSLVMAFILMPMVMPHIIVALALFYAFARVGLVGTSFGLILGHTIFSLPYAIVTIMAVLRNYDIRLDHAAWTLGATRLTTFRRVTLPIIRTGMITAFLFSFVKSFDELTVALFISGGTSTTLPRQMWADALMNVSPTLAAVSTLILALVTVVIICGEAIGRRKKSY
ncbi:ABC transporter permease subunit [Microvirga lotononidis]|uniref:ABC-type spermidine/putrescine transport system, permease component I n=1 Tax=Microvirga lotononidis TaxID=864069 RepID=I4YR10_9HYPH|nr:ABC transporter permease subunit [Microvirga lotononidis]EIM26402.1 ABC-type spermidine/putrescine transport system, permease component I [Microvirga lotononidis]WQO30765.1 ABC transporter permease subunit [Microvirga lotononidis]